VRESREALSRLERWVEQGLLTQAQADSIRDFEREETSGQRLPPAAEAVAYLGILLTVAAAFALWTRLLDDPGDPIRLAISGGLALGLLVVGWPMGATDDRGMRRIGSTLWLLGTIAVGFAVLDGYIVATDEDLPMVTTFAVGTSMLLVGGVAYLLRREAATQVAAFLGAAVAVAGLPVWLLRADHAVAVAVTLLLLLLGAGWLGLDALGRLSPAGVGRILGAIAMLQAPLYALDVRVGVWLPVGTGVSAVLLLVGVWLPGNAVAVLAGIGLFGYLTGTILHFFGETIGAPLALLLGALVLLGAAIVFSRRRRPRPDGDIPPPDAPPAAGEASESG
jgi:hypothetical protein